MKISDETTADRYEHYRAKLKKAGIEGDALGLASQYAATAEMLDEIHYMLRLLTSGRQ